MNVKERSRLSRARAAASVRPPRVELAERGVKAIGLVDRSERRSAGRPPDQRPAGRRRWPRASSATRPIRTSAAAPSTCWWPSTASAAFWCRPPASRATSSAVKMDKETGKPCVYPEDHFRLVLEVNLTAPVYWALEMMAPDRRGPPEARPEAVEPGRGDHRARSSSSARSRRRATRARSPTRRPRPGSRARPRPWPRRPRYHGVRCAVIHPGFTDTPMVRSLGEDFIKRAYPAPHPARPPDPGRRRSPTRSTS